MFSQYFITIPQQEQGAQLEREIVERLIQIAAASRQYEQRTRHRALRVAKSWNRQHWARASASDPGCVKTESLLPNG